MNQLEFLNLKNFPARVNAEQAAWLMGCQPHNLPALVAAKQLKPLGNAPPNAVKYFSTAEVLEFCVDRNWLARVTMAIQKEWARRNSRYVAPARETALPANSNN